MAVSSQRDATDTTQQDSPWIASWINSCSCNNCNNCSSSCCSRDDSCSSERLIPVGAVETAALSCGVSSSNKRRGLKKAFLVTPEAAAASSTSSCKQQQAEACSGNADSLAWEFKCTYTLKISDLEVVVLPLRGALWGVERNTNGPLNGCSLAFPLRLRSRAAFALVRTYSCCERAKASLQQLQQQQWLPKGEAQLMPPEGGQPALKSKQSADAAFLLTICLYTDAAAEAALARICPAAAAAADAAAIEAVDGAAADADKEEMSTKLHVEIDDSSSSDDDCSSVILESRTEEGS
ncbi:uncharacterized protein EMH_0077770 [Eimeria mitis]|uniref:Uncharacterized protein n=1 Tax=Eimeria mitis TaxID=44415 RepID=U6K4X0_9EIME|nr:uncharacterized protein EMH_0077770 [Eimeria mitis]CDJ32795.1 hypothetical protein EMH_0077770 [Eimeria mitis]